MAYKPTLSDIEEIDNEDQRQATPQEHSGFVDHLRKSLSGIAHVPSDLWHFTEGAAKDLVTQNPVQSAKQFYQGSRSAVQNDLLGKMHQRALEDRIPGSPFPLMKKSMQHYQPDDPRSNLTSLGHFATMALPVGRAAKLGEVGARSIADLLPKFAGKKLATAVGAGAASGALAGGVVGAPEEGAITGAVLPAGLSPLSALIRKGVRGRVTPEEFAKRRAAVPSSIRAPIGEIADSPLLKKTYGTLANVVGSGAGKPYEQINELLKSKQSEISNVPNTGISPHEFVYKNMLNSYNTAKENTKDAYTALAKAADESQTPFKRSLLDQNISPLLGSYKKKAITKSAKNLYGPFISVLEDYKNAPLKTFRDASDQIPVINDLLKDASKNNDRLAMRSLMAIKSGLLKALEDSSKDNPHLFELHKSATNASKEQGEFETLNKRDKTPFYKTYLKDGDPGSIIDQYIRTSGKTADHSRLLDSIVSKIPDDARKAMAHEYLKSDTLPQFLNKLDSINQKQRYILLKEHAPAADHMLRVSKIYPESRSPDFVPKTGYTGSKGTQAALLASGLANIASGNIKTGAAMLAAPFAGRGAQHLIRSETLKDLYQKALEKERSPATISGLPLQARTVAIAGSNNDSRKALTKEEMLDAIKEMDK